MSRFSREANDSESSPPSLSVRYFYTSPLAIDDPLSPVPPPISSSNAVFKGPPRPFSTYDDVILDQAWEDVRQRTLKHVAETKQQPLPAVAILSSSQTVSVSGNQLNQLKSPSKFNSATNEPSPASSPALRPKSVASIEGLRGLRTRGASTSGDTSVTSSYVPEGGISALESASLTGNPFIRAPTRQAPTSASRQSSTRPAAKQLDSYDWGEDNFGSETPKERPSSRETLQPFKFAEPPSTKVPVGVSRLHNVCFPSYRMEPIYWSPVGDVSPVIRGTWFYHENMMPVEPYLANLLELGYLNLKPWSQTWKDELNSAIEVGAAGEVKVLHQLWPDKIEQNSTPTTPDFSTKDPDQIQEELDKSISDLIDILTKSSGKDHKAAGTASWGKDGTMRQYKSAGVMYADDRHAYILRPSLQPSTYYNRRPLANFIRRRRDVGIHVVRGFDMVRWNHLHPVQNGSKIIEKAKAGVSSSDSGISPEIRQQMDSSLSDSEKPKVTDLIFVIHGIGQKLSERVESYHFTHAMNSFRREINVELGDKKVKSNLREEMGGIMVLPVNWRSTLSFEDGGYRDEDDTSVTNSYSLKDITPNTLPSVRNIVSDVMLDIPYYLTTGYHDKMVAAVVGEANRIYHLWCSNNPGFDRHGRVHLIAHSLGSVMAVDILSSQPTKISLAKPMNSLAIEELPRREFAFDVSNVYLAGSPTGFFLLLKKSGLLPRRGHTKPGLDEDETVDDDDLMREVTGSQGAYGCLPINNLYNIVNPYDPVAYCLNAAVDADYAASLKQGWVPSSIKPWLSSFSSFTRSQSPHVVTAKSRSAGSAANGASMTVPSSSSSVSITTSAVMKPLANALSSRLPPTVEMDTHNFTREEIAERKAYLLNDNGQVDFFMRYGGGPLEIQYLTMLGAHSSYWINRDFIKMVVVETGRRAGRQGTLPEMRAVKKKKS